MLPAADTVFADFLPLLLLDLHEMIDGDRMWHCAGFPLYTCRERSCSYVTGRCGLLEWRGQLVVLVIAAGSS